MRCNPAGASRLQSLPPVRRVAELGSSCLRMAQWHLDGLRDALSKKGWDVVAELAGNDYDVSGSWQIQRSTKQLPLHIDFEGLDDMQTLPMERAYACRLRERSKLSLHFSRQRTWDAGLRTFVSELDKIDHERDS